MHILILHTIEQLLRVSAVLGKGNVASGLVPGFSECTTSWGNKTLNQSHPDTGLHNVIQRWEPRDATLRKFYENMEIFTSHQLSLKKGLVKMAGTSMGAFPRVWLTFLPHSLGAFLLSHKIWKCPRPRHEGGKGLEETAVLDISEVFHVV